MRQRFSPFKATARSRRRGIVFIEFAFVLPIFVLMVLGIVQYALLIQATEIVTNLSREGARFGSLKASQTDQGIKDYVMTQSSQTPLRTGSVANQNDDIVLTITPPGEGRKKGDQLTIKVAYDLNSRIFLPMTAALLRAYPLNSDGHPLYEASATMRIIN